MDAISNEKFTTLACQERSELMARRKGAGGARRHTWQRGWCRLLQPKSNRRRIRLTGEQNKKVPSDLSAESNVQALLFGSGLLRWMQVLFETEKKGKKDWQVPTLATFIPDYLSHSPIPPLPLFLPSTYTER